MNGLYFHVKVEEGDKDEAAQTLQRVARGRAARKTAARKSESKQEDAAAITLQRVARGRAVRRSQNDEEAEGSADTTRTTDDADREREADGSDVPLSEQGKDVVEVQPDGSFVTRMDPSLGEKGEMGTEGGSTIADEDQDDQGEDEGEDEAGDAVTKGAIEADGVKYIQETGAEQELTEDEKMPSNGVLESSSHASNNEGSEDSDEYEGEFEEDDSPTKPDVALQQPDVPTVETTSRPSNTEAKEETTSQPSDVPENQPEKKAANSRPDFGFKKKKKW